MNLPKYDGGVIGCLTLRSTRTSPTDQKNCTIENCEGCKEPIWVSEKKRALRTLNPKLATLCMDCAVLVMSVLEELGDTKINIVNVSGKSNEK